MRIGQVIGRVTLSRVHPEIPHPRLLIVRPMTREALTTGSSKRGEELVVIDSLGAGVDSIIAISEGGEAANAYRPRKVPVDAYCAALIDELHVAD